MNLVCEDTIRLFSKPEFIKIYQNLIAAKFDLMKFIPAKAIIDDALGTGKLQKGGHVIESSSGTFALALSILCSIYGLRLSLVTGPVSPIVEWRLRQLGAEMIIVPTANNCEGGIQQARLTVLKDVLAANPDAFWPRQYTNPLNPASYSGFADLVLETLGHVDIVVGSVGSGGSLCGTAGYLRRHNPELHATAVDHNRSVLFGAEPERITKLDRDTYEQLLAMGAGIVMGNLDHTQCDDVHWVPIPKMIREVHVFHKETGFLVGPSSGACLAVAKWVARRHPDKKILTILPDHGVRYVNTMFNPDWLGRWTADLDRDWTEPRECPSPKAVNEDWCRCEWKRSSFLDRVGVPPGPRQANYNP